MDHQHSSTYHQQHSPQKEPQPTSTPAATSATSTSASQEPVHCFWALMTYGDLKFIYLSSSVQRAVSAKYKQLLGKSFFDYIHPDEAKLARKDLNAFMDVHNLYGSVTRNVCPEWKQRKLARQPESPGSASASAAALLVAANEGGLSSRGLGLNGLQNNSTNNTSANGDGYNSSSNNNNNNNNNNNSGGGDRLSSLSAASSTVLGSQPRGGQDGTETEGCKDYEDIFQNGEEDEFMILDVVMNVVSDEVVLGFFHIDGQGLYKGFWSNGICGESKESLPTLAPEILRDLQESVKARNSKVSGSHGTTSDNGSPPSSPPRKPSDSKTKRIFQLYDSHNRNLLLTWPEPGPNSPDAGTMAYNPELYTQIVKSHHIPSDALDNTTCLKRFCSKHALPSLSPSHPEPSYQVESVFIPYGHIIFACFQTSPSTPTNTWTVTGSPNTSMAATQSGSQLATPSPGQRPFSSTFESGSPADHLSGLGLLSSPGQLGSSPFGISGTQGSSSSALNSPLIIPSLPSVSPFLKHAVAGQMTMTSAHAPSPSPAGPIRSTPGTHSSPYHPYARTQGLSSSLSVTSSPSSLPLPEAMQESLSFLNDYKAVGEAERERSGKSSIVGDSPSIWHASTPHPAIAAMVGHALAPSSPAFQRTVTGADSGRNPHSRQKSGGTAEARLHSSLAPPEDTHKSGKEKDAKVRKPNASPRHPAHDAAIRNKSLSSGSSSSPPSSYQDLDSTGIEGGTSSTSGHNGHVLRVTQEEKACESCGTTNSPEWRRGQSGKKDLCNACGLRYSRSVARQNRQAQKQLEGKLPKTKAPKGAKAAKAAAAAAAAAVAATGQKSVSVERDGLESTSSSSEHYNQGGYMQQDPHQQHQHQQPQQHHQHQQQHQGLDLPYGSASFSAPGIVSGYPVAVNHTTFYHGQ
ncbi:hypothetical protein BG015_007058 [Linnemannia schmuckeri]|uniref:GATA-type domain-containing protein n=1 Tax=Linnemannia schmuckeri TaxID=64567 RepID=A0A9P5S6F7_9FUNG|nr:hypothetical protein BG015_007058 [Linnemannia schmuckeri]